MSLIRLENVSKIYKTGKVDFPALKEISFSIDKGEFLSIAGPSGSGKTTILNIIGCLDKPTEGNLYIDQTNISTQSKSDLAILRRNHIGFIFQTFNLIPILSGFENVEFPLILKGKNSAEERKSKVEEILRIVGLEDLMHRKPFEMSGGQQQRIAIARALVKEPKLVLADEPTANLDSNTGKDVLKLMQKLNKDKGITFIFSTHDQMVMDFANRIIRLKDGQIYSDDMRR